MMAPAPAALALLLALMLLPLAAAHEGHEAEHVNPIRIELAPGGEATREMTFTEGMGNGTFEQGWIFTISGLVGAGSAPMHVELRRGHTVALGAAAAAWEFTQPATQTFTASFPATDVYTLAFHNNDTTRNATLLYFFDQSCNCAGKPIPVEVANGLVIFNVDVKRGATWMATFPEPRAYPITVALAEQTGSGGRWPQDFRVLQTSAQATTRDVGAGPVRLHEVQWTSPADERAYFFVTAGTVDLSRVDRSSAEAFLGSLMITPYYEQVASTTPKPTPAPEAPLLALAIVVGSLLTARRR
jgi:hypothetical protein